MLAKNNLLKQLSLLSTEKSNSSSHNIDSLSTEDILRVINKEDTTVPTVIRKEIKHIAKAVKLIVKSLKSGGRLIYIGAGTSGRLGVLDAVEIPPTYGTNTELVRAIIAGGKKAVFRSKEGSEDQRDEAIKSLQKLKISNKDIVCGIAASFRTPFVCAGLEYAKSVGAVTIMITTNPRSLLKQKIFSNLNKSIDVAICPNVGPEVIMGSTRMKSGTAQKLVLNMLTTTTMIQLGKVYGNMMVDLKMNSRKLEERAKRVLIMTTGIDYDGAEKYLKKAHGHVKTAIVMIIKNVDKNKAQKLLIKAKGFIKNAIK